MRARFVAVSYWDFHVFMIPRQNGDQASPSPGAPFHAPRPPLPPALLTAAVPCITRRQSSLWCRRHSLRCHLQGPCSCGQMEWGTRQGWDNRFFRSSRRPSSYQDEWIRYTLVNPGLSTRMLAIFSIIEKSQPLLIEGRFSPCFALVWVL